MIKNKKYYVDLINSSKANKFTAYYHYSGVGFKKAVINLGIYRLEDHKLVGVLQWGSSFQDAIKLDRYVKNDVKKNEYLELNRFCMADSEGKNSEPQAISLGVKWIKKNRPDIRLLVSYAGRKEGNYGYIYQCTNWEYLGYFISQGFWMVDGEERHLVTLWYRHTKYGNENLGFIDDICEMYHDVRKTWTKQFIYVIRLDKDLELASPALPYPKESNEFPIKTKEHIYKENIEYKDLFQPKRGPEPNYYYEKESLLFTRQTLLRRGEIIPVRKRYDNLAYYDISGHLIGTVDSLDDFVMDGYNKEGIKRSINENKAYKNIYFKVYPYGDIPEEIDTPLIGIIDEIPFNSFAEAGRYLGLSRQAVQQSRARKGKKIGGKEVIWIYDD